MTAHSDAPVRFITDRTSIETDWSCARKFYWYRLHGGRGIVPVEEPSYYRTGRELHADLAAIAIGASARDLAKEKLDRAYAGPNPPGQIDLEQAWWHAGMLIAFGQYLLPRWQEHYDPVLVEKELVLSRPPLEIACTADLVMQARPSSPLYPRVIVIDYKTVSWLAGGWMHHWPYAVQMQINPKAVEESLGLKVDATYVVGIQKGAIRDGRLRHPYIWGYSNETDATQWRHDYKPYPWYPRGLWEKGGVDVLAEWVTQLGEPLALDQFPMSAPIHANDRVLAQLIDERTTREVEIAAWKAWGNPTGPTIFPHAYNNCRPVIGSACPYLDACHNAEVNADPLGSGRFVPRTPHHDVEWLESGGEL